MQYTLQFPAATCYKPCSTLAIHCGNPIISSTICCSFLPQLSLRTTTTWDVDEVLPLFFPDLLELRCAINQLVMNTVYENVRRLEAYSVSSDFEFEDDGLYDMCESFGRGGFPLLTSLSILGGDESMGGGRVEEHCLEELCEAMGVELEVELC